MFREFPFAKLDILLKIKPSSGSICKYENLKLWHACEIYLTVRDGNHELDFSYRIPNEIKLRIDFNVVFSNSRYISDKNFVKHILMKITLNNNKLPSSFQDLPS